MNKKEKSIILDTYKNVLEVQRITGLDKSDSIREFKVMLDKLGLKLDRYIIENKAIAKEMQLTGIQEEAFEMMFNDCIKYGRYDNYGNNLIDAVYCLEFEMTEEEIKCNKARINIITNK